MSIKKIGIVILTLAMLATMIIIPASAIEVDTMDYDSNDLSIYKTSLTTIEDIFTLEAINTIYKNSNLNLYNVEVEAKKTYYLFYSYFYKRDIKDTDKDALYINQIYISNDFNTPQKNNLFIYVYYIKCVDGILTNNRWGGDITIDANNNISSVSIISSDINYQGDIFFVADNEARNLNGSQYGFMNYVDNQVNLISKDQGIKLYFEPYGPLTYVEPLEMAFRANVTAVIPWLLGLMGTVVTSIFTPSGSLWGLAPLVVIGASVFIILIVHKVIKRFAWGV